MKKLKIEELKIQSFVTSFAKDESADQLIGGTYVGQCGSIQGQCTTDPNCTDNCNTTSNCHYHTESCHAVTIPDDQCSYRFCYTVNASHCPGGGDDYCYIDDGDGPV